MSTTTFTLTTPYYSPSSATDVVRVLLTAYPVPTVGRRRLVELLLRSVAVSLTGRPDLIRERKLPRMADMRADALLLASYLGVSLKNDSFTGENKIDIPLLYQRLALGLMSVLLVNAANGGLAIESFLASYDDATLYLRSAKSRKVRVQVAEVAGKRAYTNKTMKEERGEVEKMIREMSAVKRMKEKMGKMMKAGARGARDAEKRNDRCEGEMFLGRVAAALETSPFGLA
ncbi:hypothetical protein BDV93DRAFT_551972 [Ceratobasidium sp. AG-I]|nr:hypothetical protein BDV93DRAFT_551972 [Ceratobasidium sp. AG-I]